MPNKRGFTVIELLIVIVVIGILAALVLNTFRGAQERARVAAATSELKDIETALKLLQTDVNKWPNGCPVSAGSNPEIAVELVDAGLTAQPNIGVIDPPCEWTAVDVARWQGPYLQAEEVQDPWGFSYQFDPDYYPYQSCASETSLPEEVAIASYGPDNSRYTCDDVYRSISY